MKTPRWCISRAALSLAAVFTLTLSAASAASLKSLKPPKKSAVELRSEYLTRLTQSSTSPPLTRSVGSLWSPDAILADPSADYKARALHDTVIVQASVQTTAAQSGNLGSSRDFSTNSAISGLIGALSTKGTNPLLTAQSECTGTCVTSWTEDIRYSPLRRVGLDLLLLLYTKSRRRGRGNVAIPKGFPRSVGRVGSRLYGFPGFPHSVISMVCICL